MNRPLKRQGGGHSRDQLFRKIDDAFLNVALRDSFFWTFFDPLPPSWTILLNKALPGPHGL